MDFSEFPPEVIFRHDGNFELLGGPVGTETFCNAHTQKRVDKATITLPDCQPYGASLLVRELDSAHAQVRICRRCCLSPLRLLQVRFDATGR